MKRGLELERFVAVSPSGMFCFGMLTLIIRQRRSFGNGFLVGNRHFVPTLRGIYMNNNFKTPISSSIQMFSPNEKGKNDLADRLLAWLSAR